MKNIKINKTDLSSIGCKIYIYDFVVWLLSIVFSSLLKVILIDKFTLNVSLCENFELYCSIVIANVSIVFLTTSLLSVLSDNSNILYWKDLVKEVLIEPKGLSFYNLSILAYTFGFSSILSLFLTTLPNFAGIWLITSTICSIITIVILFNRMTLIYFKRDKYAKKSIKEIDGLIKDNNAIALNKKIYKLNAYTLKQIEEKNIDTVLENLNLLIYIKSQKPDSLHLDSLIMHLLKESAGKLPGLIKLLMDIQIDKILTNNPQKLNKIYAYISFYLIDDEEFFQKLDCYQKIELLLNSLLFIFLSYLDEGNEVETMLELEMDEHSVFAVCDKINNIFLEINRDKQEEYVKMIFDYLDIVSLTEAYKNCYKKCVDISAQYTDSNFKDFKEIVLGQLALSSDAGDIVLHLLRKDSFENKYNYTYLIWLINNSFAVEDENFNKRKDSCRNWFIRKCLDYKNNSHNTNIFTLSLLSDLISSFCQDVNYSIGKSNNLDAIREYYGWNFVSNICLLREHFKDDSKEIINWTELFDTYKSLYSNNQTMEDDDLFNFLEELSKSENA